MRRGLKAALILLLSGALVATAGCSKRAGTSGSGGGGGAAGATAGSGGTAGGGGAGTMGIAGSGGGAGGSAGTTGIAGSGGGGGDAGTTGSAGSGGSAGGDAGTTGAAGSGGVAGGNAGTTGVAGAAGIAGAAGAAGAAGGNAGSGGAPGTGGMGTGGMGTGGTGTGGSLPTVAQLFPEGADGSLDGRLVTIPCDQNVNGTDCPSGGAYYRGVHIPCAAAQLNVLHTFPVGGAPGATYRVTMHFYGILGPRNYGTDATREAVSGRPGNQDSGAVPTPWATAPAGHTYPPSDYDTYEIRVDDQADQEVAAYYLNADTQEGLWTYVINFAKQINVIGGGKIRVRNRDRNCRQVKNCGPNNTLPSQCAAIANARIIDVSAASPAPANAPANMGGLLQPNLSATRSASESGQWTLIDVVSVDSIVP